MGIGPEPPGLVHGSSAGLFQGGEDMAEIENIRDEKKRAVDWSILSDGKDSIHLTMSG